MKKVLSYLVSTFIFNTAIAGVLTMMMQGDQLWTNFIDSQSIGLSVMAVNGTIVYVLKSSIMRWAVLSITFADQRSARLDSGVFL
jgi:hypothetical protein